MIKIMHSGLKLYIQPQMAGTGHVGALSTTACDAPHSQFPQTKTFSISSASLKSSKKEKLYKSFCTEEQLTSSLICKQSGHG